MVLLRPWDTRPTSTPIIRFECVTTKADDTKEAKEKTIRLFHEQLAHSLKERDITISGIEEISEIRGKMQTDYVDVDVHLTFRNRAPIAVRPDIFPTIYNGLDGTRKIKASWAKPCRHCLSESHPKASNGQCPWLTATLPNDRHPSETNYSTLRPGQTERRQKRKREDEAQMIDIRPTEKKEKERRRR
jgi:hypothetical protein